MDKKRDSVRRTGTGVPGEIETNAAAKDGRGREISGCWPSLPK